MPNFSPTAKIAIATDHAGFALKTLIIDHLKKAGREVLDLGAYSDARVDYPDYGFALAEALKKGEAEVGIALCGSGIGISIAVNRYAGMRCALCSEVTSARLARQHNDANVLALGARMIGADLAFDCVDVFLKTEFEGGRHQGRVEKLGKCGAP